MPQQLRRVAECHRLFTDAFTAECTCSLCGNLFENPHTFNGCDHVFCRDCVIPTLEGVGINESKCPTCGQPGWKKELQVHLLVSNIAEILRKATSGQPASQPLAEQPAAAAASGAAQPSSHAMQADEAATRPFPKRQRLEDGSYLSSPSSANRSRQHPSSNAAGACSDTPGTLEWPERRPEHRGTGAATVCSPAPQQGHALGCKDQLSQLGDAETSPASVDFACDESPVAASPASAAALPAAAGHAEVAAAAPADSHRQPQADTSALSCGEAPMEGPPAATALACMPVAEAKAADTAAAAAAAAPEGLGKQQQAGGSPAALLQSRALAEADAAVQPGSAAEAATVLAGRQPVQADPSVQWQGPSPAARPAVADRRQGAGAVAAEPPQRSRQHEPRQQARQQHRGLPSAGEAPATAAQGAAAPAAAPGAAPDSPTAAWQLVHDMLRDGIQDEHVHLHLHQDAEDEEQALKADLNHIRWSIASVQRSIAALPPAPPPARPLGTGASLGTATLGLGDSCLLGTERSLDAIDADMRAHGYSVPSPSRDDEPQPPASLPAEDDTAADLHPSSPGAGRADCRAVYGSAACSDAVDDTSPQASPARYANTQPVGQQSASSQQETAARTAEQPEAMGGGAQMAAACEQQQQAGSGEWQPGGGASSPQQQAAGLRRLRKAQPSGVAAAGQPANGRRGAHLAGGDDGSLHAGAGRKRGPSLVGQRVEVYWPEDDKWYAGQAKLYNGRKGKHLIHYDDDQTEDLALAEERWRLVGGSQPNPADLRCRRQAVRQRVPLPTLRSSHAMPVQRRPRIPTRPSDSGADSEADSQADGSLDSSGQRSGGRDSLEADSSGGDGREGGGADSGSGSGADYSGGSDGVRPQASKRSRRQEGDSPQRQTAQPLRLTLQGAAARSAAYSGISASSPSASRPRPRLRLQAVPAARPRQQPPEPAAVGDVAAMMDTQAAAELLSGLHCTASPVPQRCSELAPQGGDAPPAGSPTAGEAPAEEPARHGGDAAAAAVVKPLQGQVGVAPAPEPGAHSAKQPAAGAAAVADESGAVFTARPVAAPAAAAEPALAPGTVPAAAVPAAADPADAPGTACRLGPPQTPAVRLKTPASGGGPPNSRRGPLLGNLATAYKTPALRRISNSTAAGSPDWWQASLATAGRQHSAAGAGGQGAGSGQGAGDLQPPAGSQADGEQLFACLGWAQPPGAAPRQSAHTPAAPRLSIGFETPKTGKPGTQSLQKARGGRSPLRTLSQRAAPPGRRIISCSGLHGPQLKLLSHFAQHTGDSFVIDNRSTAPPEGTTHLVINVERGQASRRTLKVLRAMLRGCWLLCWKWVEESVKGNAWQPEADFEVQGVQCPGGLQKPEGPRRARLRHGAGKPKLLYGMDEAIVLGGSVTEDAEPLSRGELGVLIHEAGGNFEDSMGPAIAAAEQRFADAVAAALAAAAADSILIGDGDTQVAAPAVPAPKPTVYVLATGADAAEVASLSKCGGVLVLRLTWLLDCIATMRILPTEGYQLSCVG